MIAKYLAHCNPFPLLFFGQTQEIVPALFLFSYASIEKILNELNNALSLSISLTTLISTTCFFVCCCCFYLYYSHTTCSCANLRIIFLYLDHPWFINLIGSVSMTSGFVEFKNRKREKEKAARFSTIKKLSLRRNALIKN